MLLATYQREVFTTPACYAVFQHGHLLKTRFDYPVFLYEAEKVGMTATGEPDSNELYPNPRQPQGLEMTALEQYRAFVQDATPFFV